MPVDINLESRPVAHAGEPYQGRLLANCLLANATKVVTARTTCCGAVSIAIKGDRVLLVRKISHVFNAFQTIRSHSFA